jgi:hypothetical protein
MVPVRNEWRAGAKVCIALALTLVATLFTVAPATAAPNVPTGLTPDGTTIGTNPQLRWTAVGGAESYRVQIDDSSNFGSLLVNETTVNTTYTPRIALPSSELYWRVASIDDSGESNFAEASFTKELQAPTQNAPADGAVFAFPTQTVTFSWSSLPVKSYVLEIDDAEDFINPTRVVTRATQYTMVQTQSNDQDFYWRVLGSSEKNGSGVLTPWSSTRSYSISWTNAPTPLTPPNSTAVSVTDAVLSWTPVHGADHYELQINTAVDFSGAMVVSTNVESTRYGKPATLNNGSYHWRVRAVDNDGHVGTWSDIWSFTRGWPSVPTLLHPLDDELEANPLRFEWTPVDHASHYELQVGYDEAFSPNTFDVCMTNQTTFQPYAGGTGTPGVCQVSMVQEGSPYYWRVRAIDAPTGVLGLWSSINSFIYYEGLYDPITPIGGVTTSLPVLDWEPIQWAEKYRVTILDKNGGTVVNATTYSSSYTPTAGLNAANSPFSWYVTTINHADLFGLTPTVFYHETFDYVLPSSSGASPEPITPAAGAASTEMPSMTWTPVSGADRYDIVYRLPGASTQQTLIQNVKAAGYTHTSLLPPGNYEFSVIAKNATGQQLSQGAYRAFTMLTLSPAVLTSPANCAPTSVCDTLAYTPTMDWQDVPDAAFYKVYVARDANFTNIYRTYDVFQSEFTPREEYADNDAGQAYYWHVRPCQSNSLCAPDPSGTAAPSRAFQKRSNRVLLESPANGAVVQNQPTFAWEDYLASNQPPLDPGRLESHIGARQYRIQVATDPGFVNKVDDTFVDLTTYTPISTTYPEGPLYWRVRGIDGSGNELTWSDVRMVTKTSPSLVTQLPANGATVQGFPTFSWASQHFASWYTIEVYRNGDLSFSTPNRVLVQGTDYSRWTAADLFAPGVYAWRIRRDDSIGRDGPWTSGGTFTVGNRVVTLIGLPDGAIVPDNNMLFSWQAVSGAASYRFQLSTKSSFQNPSNTETVMTSWAPTARLNDGTYYWRIQALDGSGNVIGLSEVRSFARDGTRPEVTSNTPTDEIALDQPFRVTFSEPVENVTANSFTITADGSTKFTVASVTVIDASTYELEPDQPLLPGQSYTIALTDAITDLNGLKLVPFDWTVTTQRTIENTSFGMTQTWARIKQSGASGGKVDAAFTAGASTRFRFTGTEVAVIGSRGPKGGFATVFIDGVEQPGRINFYSASVRTQQQVFTIGGLENRRHVVEVRVAGSKAQQSGGTWVWIDAFKSNGVTFQETHRQVRDRFATVQNSGARGGSYAFMSHTGGGKQPSYKMRFVGTGVVWRGVKGPEFGKATVYIDGRKKGVIDLYAPDLETNQVLFDSGNLDRGAHRIEIRIMGKKSRPAKGTAVTVDYLEVKG